MKLEKLLQQIGLSKNEAMVYLASLESGLSSAQNIALKANLPRTTVYSVLKELVKKGIVAQSLIKGKTRFLASEPERLRSTLSELQNKLEDAMPQFKAIQNEGETNPKILFYEGKHAMQKVYDDTLLENPEEILEWNTDDYFRFKEFEVDPQYIQKRVEKNIKARRIAGKTSLWESKHKRKDEEELSETIIVPKENFWPSVEVNIYGNKVAFLNYAEKSSVIIESKALAEAMKQAYELSWIGAKSLER